MGNEFSVAASAAIETQKKKIAEIQNRKQQYIAELLHLNVLLEKEREILRVERHSIERLKASKDEKRDQMMHEVKQRKKRLAQVESELTAIVMQYSGKIDGNVQETILLLQKLQELNRNMNSTSATMGQLAIAVDKMANSLWPLVRNCQDLARSPSVFMDKEATLEWANRTIVWAAPAIKEHSLCMQQLLAFSEQQAKAIIFNQGKCMSPTHYKLFQYALRNVKQNTETLPVRIVAQTSAITKQLHAYCANRSESQDDSEAGAVATRNNGKYFSSLCSDIRSLAPLIEGANASANAAWAKITEDIQKSCTWNSELLKLVDSIMSKMTVVFARSNEVTSTMQGELDETKMRRTNRNLNEVETLVQGLASDHRQLRQSSNTAFQASLHFEVGHKHLESLAGSKTSLLCEIQQLETMLFRFYDDYYVQVRMANVQKGQVEYLRSRIREVEERIKQLEELEASTPTCALL